jgi:hypothetical protein
MFVGQRKIGTSAFVSSKGSSENIPISLRRFSKAGLKEDGR